MPAPGARVEKNGSPARAKTSGPMPMPPSRTSKRAEPSDTEASSDTRAGSGAAARPLRTRFTSACASAVRGARSVASGAEQSTARRCHSRGSRRPRTAASSAARSIGSSPSPRSAPASPLMRARISRQRAASSRIRRASSASASAPGSWRAARSSSAAATAIVPSGEPSSWAAPAASADSATSFSLREAERSSVRKRSSRSRSAAAVRATK